MNLYIYNNTISKFAEAREADNAPELFQKMKIQGMLSLVHHVHKGWRLSELWVVIQWNGGAVAVTVGISWFEFLTSNYRTSNIDTKN